MTRAGLSGLIQLFAALCLVLGAGLTTGCEDKAKDKEEKGEEGEGGGEEGEEGEEGEDETGESGESAAGDESGEEDSMEPPPVEADRQVDGLELQVTRSQRIDRGEPQRYYTLLLVGEVPASSVAFGYLRPDLPEGARYEKAMFNDPTDRMKLRNREFAGTKAEGIKLEYTVSGVSDDTETLAKLGGSLMMVVPAQTEEIMIEAPLEKVGGKLEHPKLAEAGIEVTLDKSDGKNPGFTVAQTAGEVGALENVELYMKDGESARASTTTDMAKPLPIFKIRPAADDVTLEDVKLGLKINQDFEIVKGTFAAENVEVP